MSILFSILANLVMSVFLPLLTKWLEQLFAMLNKSKKAKQRLNEVAPKTVEEFKALLPELCDLAISDKLGINHHTKRRLLWAKNWLCSRDRVIRAAWNQAIITNQLPKGVALTPAPDDAFGEVMVELMQPPEPMVAGVTKRGRPPLKKKSDSVKTELFNVNDQVVEDLPLEFKPGHDPELLP